MLRFFETAIRAGRTRRKVETYARVQYESVNAQQPNDSNEEQWDLSHSKHVCSEYNLDGFRHKFEGKRSGLGGEIELSCIRMPRLELLVVLRFFQLTAICEYIILNIFLEGGRWRHGYEGGNVVKVTHVWVGPPWCM